MNKTFINRIQDSRRVVIKVGTSTLLHDNGKMDLRHFGMLCRVMTDLQNSGREVTLVSSGAIGVGLGKLGLSKRPNETSKKQALAAIGQCELMFMYDKLFGEYDQTVAQILVTADVLDEPETRKNVTNTFNRLIDMGIIPIVNENDTVATTELEGRNIGDNDTLSAIVAKLIDADLLIILTDIDGLYDGNPDKDPDARLIPLVEEITPEIRQLAGSAGTRFGTGGMSTKIHAAEIATKAGIPCFVIAGNDPTNLYKIFDGEKTGTLFASREK
jgi:glutamate 5-kinase